MPHDDDSVVAGPCPISIRDYGGSGSPVLLLHGASRGLTDWTPIAERLVEDHRVVAMDLRGHGQSGEAPWVWDEVLADVDRVIAATQLSRPAIVGHSLGGIIAALHSARGGESSCVVNLDGYWRGTEDQYVGMGVDEVHAFWDELAEMPNASRPDAKGPITEAELQKARAAAEQAAKTGNRPVDVELATFDRSVLRLPEGCVLKPRIGAVTELLDSLSPQRWFDVFAQVTVPFLIYNCVRVDGGDFADDRQARIWAAYRRGIARDLAALAELSPNLRVRTCDVDHMLILSIPAVVAAEISDFVAAATS